MLSSEIDPPRYSEWKNNFIFNSINKNEIKCNEIKNCSLKTKDKLSLLKKLKDKIETTILAIENQ